MNAQKELRKSMRKGTKTLFALFVLLTVAAVIEYLLNVSVVIYTLTTMMIAVLGVIIFFRVFFLDHLVKQAPDERAKKIRAYALSNSWYVIIASAVGLMLANQIMHLELSANSSLMYILLIANCSFLGLHWYYGRKPDVDLNI